MVDRRRVTRLLANILPFLSSPKYSLSLPLFNELGNRPGILQKDVGIHLEFTIPPNFHTSRRKKLPSPTIKCPETISQGPHIADTGSGAIPKAAWKVAEDLKRESHFRREKELKQILEPLLNSDASDVSIILLCWGRHNQSYIIPVKVSNSADEVTTWHKIRQVWYAHRGSWRRRIPLFGVLRVDPVEVRRVQSMYEFADRCH